MINKLYKSSRIESTWQWVSGLSNLRDATHWMQDAHFKDSEDAEAG
jgi:hypothetical protein